MTAFVDTNVLLDVLARREPFYAAAARIWVLAERGLLTAYVSAISFNNIYYIVRKAEGKAKADRAMVLLRDVFTPAALTAQLLNQAMDADINDFEDAIQYHSATHTDADCLISRNPGHFPQNTIPVLSPEEFISTFGASIEKTVREM